MSIIIRKATEADEAALSRICLVTADAGSSAEHLHDFGELPGLVFAVPYVKLPTTWGFVMEDETKKEIVGYVVGSNDTRYYEQYAKEHWWPPLAEKYPEERMSKSGDVTYAKMLKDMFTAQEASIRYSSVHLHINILDGYRGKGWGRKLIGTATEYLKGEGFEAVWVGTDPRNDKAKVFYQKIGFKHIEGADENQFGLRFWAFK